jgi:hypothetical protein
MKKIFLFAAAALMSINAWSFDNVAATFTWTVGNEAEATVASDASDGVKETKRKVGTSLVEGERNNFSANPGVAMVTYNPTAGNAGTEASVMVEYRVKMKKGVTFTLSEISYDAIKQGTDGASYHWSYVVDGTESAKTKVDQDDIRRDNNTAATAPALRHTHVVTATAGREVAVRFYVSGFNTGKLFCLDSIRLVGTVNGEEEVRAFTDFKIEFRTNPSQVILPTTGILPTGVAVEGTAYNGDQHGIQGGTITVPVDGPVKFTFGACQYSTTTIEIKKDGVHYATFSNNASCGEKTPNYNQNVTWLYNVEEAATLTFELGSQTYLPYFFAEACEFVPSVEVRYFDTDGSLLGSEVVDGSSALVYKYGAADVKVADGFAFRGWFNGDGANALKVPAGTPMNEDISLYAKATEIEIPAMGKIFNYDLRPKSFYPEDHEVLVFNGGAYNDATHGWRFGNGNTLGIKVAGNALIVVGLCRYSHTGDTELRDAENNLIGKLTTENNVTPDGELQSISYTGDATTLTFHFTATDYIHSIKVYNIVDLPQKDDYGYYEVAPGDAAGLILTLESMAAGEKVFLPNGVYDLGDACLTTISKNNVSIIGQSMEGTIIKNTPDYRKEGIGTTATILITATNTYLQDLTLWNNLDYFAALAKLNNGRGVCLQDKGMKTICKNVRMLSNQDTYYSNKQGAVKYFEDCEIHGTVDFICGDGSVYFKNNVLVGEQRNASGGGANAITASNADASDKGYVFEGCRVKYAENIQGTLPVMSLGRSWNNAPKCVFLNTILDDSNGALNLYKDASQQKDKIARWTLGAMNKLPEKFGEFNSMDKDGNIVSPASNNVTFVLGSDEKQMETILTADDAAAYTIDYTLGAWAADAQNDAKQAVCEEKAEDFEPDAIYMAETEGEKPILFKGGEFNDKVALYNGITYIIRKANGRGGFGLPAGTDPQGVDNTAAEGVKVQKIIRNGQVIIVRDGKEYNVLGAQL